jgi:GNAT superfamily N-acetyltransferase
MLRAPSIRPVQPGDDLSRLTDLIHAAYAPQAARGLRFWGTHQSVEDTAKRLAWGHGLLAELDGQYVGTITVRPPQPDSPVLMYRNGQTWTISQFAVAPSFKGRGVGKALHEAAVRHAMHHGASVMALDTAAPAQGLIAMYTAWGYQPVGEHSWHPLTNYVSVVMCRSLVHPGMLSSTLPDQGHAADT